MKKSLILPIFFLLVCVVILSSFVQDIECKSRGSSRGSSGSGRGFRGKVRKFFNGGKSKQSSGNVGNQYSGGGWRQPTKAEIPKTPNSGITKGTSTKKKGFFRKNWKKAVAFGAGAYVGHKVAKNVHKLFRPNIFDYNGVQYDFDTWDRNARVDGWVCRSDNDCNWLDPQLECDDREFTITEIKGVWPWKAELRGRCACRDNFVFDSENGTCNNIGWATWILVLLGVFLIFVIIGVAVCCCCGVRYLTKTDII